MDNKLRILALALLIIGLGACTQSVKEGEEGAPVIIEERDTSAGVTTMGAETSAEGAQLSGAGGMEALSDPNNPLSQRVFYFDFDRHEVPEADRAALAAHAAYLAEHAQLSVVVEGHADERGSREYNLALGERRAKAVASLLKLQGAGREQLQVISFGEERPVALEHDEAAWRLNRRVELLYSGN